MKSYVLLDVEKLAVCYWKELWQEPSLYVQSAQCLSLQEMMQFKESCSLLPRHRMDVPTGCAAAQQQAAGALLGAPMSMRVCCICAWLGTGADV